jgi:molybdopterin synthase catalytic subunit
MATPTTDHIELVNKAIDAAPITARVRGTADGAMVVFDGFVRDHSKGRRTLYLEYEAYEAMAMAQMQEIAAQLHQRYAIDRVAMVHRLGRLEIGETSILIAVSAAHRAVAFEACRYAIDTLKSTVPIWKKEYFEDGSVWADGQLPAVPSATPATEGAS